MVCTMYNSTKDKWNSHTVRRCTSHTTFGVSMERVFGVTVSGKIWCWTIPYYHEIIDICTAAPYPFFLLDSGLSGDQMCNVFYTLSRFSQITKEFEPDVFSLVFLNDRCCYEVIYQRLMSEGLSYNLCVAPFLNICVPCYKMISYHTDYHIISKKTKV